MDINDASVIIIDHQPLLGHGGSGISVYEDSEAGDFEEVFLEFLTLNIVFRFFRKKQRDKECNSRKRSASEKSVKKKDRRNF